MDSVRQTTHSSGAGYGHCRLKFVDFHAYENHISHETLGLSRKHLVVRRGKPFRLTLMFHSRWNPHAEGLVLEVFLGSLSQRVPVQLSDQRSDPQHWSAKIHPGDMQPQSVTVHVCSPVLCSVAAYDLLVHTETKQSRRSFTVGTFVLLCNPRLKADPVHMPLDAHIEEYVKSDYGLVYMGTTGNVSKRPWSFGQYEPGVLEACLKLLQVSPQHLRDRHKDYIRRAEPVYLSRVLCAMVNCNDDLGVLEGKWQGSYKDGVRPTEWSGSADILHRWVSSSCSPVRYGQCWVYASVLCTVLRALGIPSRVVTIFNAAHDTDATLKIEEFYSSTGEKLNLSKDSIWNFHAWVECWMKRPDLGAEFDGWQVVDPTPQERSTGTFVCGPCPVAAIQRRCFGAAYDAPFIYASVDADVVRVIVRDGRAVGRTVDTVSVGQLIYTKSVGSDAPDDLTHAYKSNKRGQQDSNVGGTARRGGTSPSLEVSLNVDGAPSVGASISMSVRVTNWSNSSRVLMEHVNAQVKEYNRGPQECFWKAHRELHIQPGGVFTLCHSIPASAYESVLAGDDIVNLAVVIKDVRTEERVLATQEFNMSSPQITIEIEGGGEMQVNREHTAHVSFVNRLTKTLSGAVLTVAGSGLLQGKREARLVLLRPGEKLATKVSIKATSPGTKLLMSTFSHSHSPSIVATSYCKVSVISA